VELTTTPIRFHVDHDTRTVLTTARGVLRIKDFVAHTHKIVKAGVFEYSQLINAREAHLDITPSDVLTLVSLMKDLRNTHGPAKTAFVAKHPADFGMMRMYEIKIGEDDSGFAVFYDIYQAEQWIFT
jgi:hypothetical protein